MQILGSADRARIHYAIKKGEPVFCHQAQDSIAVETISPTGRIGELFRLLSDIPAAEKPMRFHLTEIMVMTIWWRDRAHFELHRGKVDGLWQTVRLSETSGPRFATHRIGEPGEFLAGARDGAYHIAGNVWPIRNIKPEGP